MKLFLTAPVKGVNARFFPPHLLKRLSQLGELVINPTEESLSRDEILPYLTPDIDVVLTHWGSIQYDKEMLDHLPHLRIIAHCAGTVARIASEEAYARGIKVISANSVTARYVAEWVLGAMIALTRSFSVYDKMVRDGKWRRGDVVIPSLFHLPVGLVGCGMIGRKLLTLLAPFGCPVAVYDPYLSPDALSAYPAAHLASFEEVMHCAVVSLHASQNPETYHMINADALAMMPDGGVLINCARGSLIDMDALISELQNERLSAAIDVYEREGQGVRQDERLLAMTKNTILSPHVSGLSVGSRMTEAVIEDLERYQRGEPMHLTISVEQFRRMTQE